jgi:outer membrane lipoprotein SlyB
MGFASHKGVSLSGGKNMANERYSLNDTDTVVTDTTTDYTDDNGTLGQVSGTGAGAISGGVIGGAVGGPIGAVVGAVAGGVLGSAAGEAAHHMGDDTSLPTYEDTTTTNSLAGSASDTSYGDATLHGSNDIGNDVPGVRSDTTDYISSADDRSIAERAAEDAAITTPRFDSTGQRIV